jgi:hypothetical protein
MAVSFLARNGFAQTAAEDTRARFRKMSEESERRGLASRSGITTDGNLVEGCSDQADRVSARQAPGAENFSPVDGRAARQMLFLIDDASGASG